MEGAGWRWAMPFVARGAAFLILWVVLIGAGATDLLAGVAAAAAATWASTVLWPQGPGVSVPGFLRFAARFLCDSLMAGLDVARRAFAKDPGLDPGFTRYQPAAPPGMTRGALCAVLSLQPGKLPVLSEPDGTLIVHCLDMTAPVGQELAQDEAAFLGMFKSETDRG